MCVDFTVNYFFLNYEGKNYWSFYAPEQDENL